MEGCRCPETGEADQPGRDRGWKLADRSNLDVGDQQSVMFGFLDLMHEFIGPRQSFDGTPTDLGQQQPHFSQKLWCHLLRVPTYATQQCPQLAFLHFVGFSMFVLLFLALMSMYFSSSTYFSWDKAYEPTCSLWTLTPHCMRSSHSQSDQRYSALMDSMIFNHLLLVSSPENRKSST